MQGHFCEMLYSAGLAVRKEHVSAKLCLSNLYCAHYTTKSRFCQEFFEQKFCFFEISHYNACFFVNLYIKQRYTSQVFPKTLLQIHPRVPRRRPETGRHLKTRSLLLLMLLRQNLENGFFRVAHLFMEGRCRNAQRTGAENDHLLRAVGGRYPHPMVFA